MICNQVVKGLKFLLDELKINHLDIKPDNVIVFEDYSCKLIDFGISGKKENTI